MIKAILQLLTSLFGGGSKSKIATNCGLPDTIEIQPPVSHDAVPEVTTTAQVVGFAGHTAPAIGAHIVADEFSVQSAGYKATVRPELGSVNLRLGPSIKFEPPVAKTKGGVEFDLVGASEPDDDDLRWFMVKLGTDSAWIRSDLVNLSEDTIELSFITAEDLKVSPPPATSELFPLPVPDGITQGYHSNHKGFDMGSKTGTPLIAPVAGVCIRRIDCTKCTSSKPNYTPNANWQCPATWSDPAWGFGYGNFIVLRYDYAVVPATTRTEMDKYGLTNGFVYVILAHMARIDIPLGKQFKAGDSLGATGNTGCSTGDHLHFEVRIGKDENVDGKWTSQRALHPKLFFQT